MASVNGPSTGGPPPVVAPEAPDPGTSSESAAPPAAKDGVDQAATDQMIFNNAFQQAIFQQNMAPKIELLKPDE